ncbi:GNAT family N-acetyltransferase [Litorivicinus sp.]|jgi:predicted GNAT family N-acyltransferase|nr:GNAT family N-acetyltransferase [Litorivicinus sp.]|tara:strand:+ start:16901 stop:17563 length:663 start_codon:yes stop_codon:yes gene_type:complete
MQILKVSWQTHQTALQTIRTAVFIDEQGIDPKDEWDPLDTEAIHLLAIHEEYPVGCARIMGLRKIGRMAVLSNMRRKNIGSSLLKKAVSYIRAAGNTPTLGAQIDAMSFYANHGFLPTGNVFDDARIPHRTMTLIGDTEKSLNPLNAVSLEFTAQTRAISIEPKIKETKMHIQLPRLSEDDAAWLTPRLCCYASTHGMSDLTLRVPEGEVSFPINPPAHF